MRYFKNPNAGNAVYGYDEADHTQAALLAAAISGKWVEVTDSWRCQAAPTAAQTTAIYAAALTFAINSQAQAWGYDNMVSAASYATSTVPKFADEAKALIAWRDAAWVAAEALLAAVTAGTTPAPANQAAFLTAVLPAVPARPTA